VTVVGAAVVVGDAFVAGAAVVPGVSVAAEVAGTTLRPGAVRAATIANSPAPTTAQAVTARVTIVSRRMPWFRAETWGFISVQFRSSC
jgi:membrane-bound ClpP family serine protease